MAFVRTTTPDGTDLAHLARHDTAWATYSEALIALVAPDFVYEDNVMPDHAGETYRGLEGLRRAMATFAEPFETMVFDLERIVGSGDHVVSIHRVRARARETAISFDFQAAYIWSFRDGRIVRILGFLDLDEAFKTAGLAE
jgi:ketosteroid isomerase-like protein